MKKAIILLAALVYMMPVGAGAQAGVLLRDAILANNTLRNGADFSVVADSTNTATQEGLFSAPDSHGTSHFFRGTHAGLNNNVIFAGYQWKIIRIEGNGNIRLIYNGTCPNNTCTINGNTAAAATAIGPNAFNTAGNQNRFIGYMYGSETGTFAQQHANTNSSNIKNVIDNWFDNNITGADRALVVNNTIFCVDRSLGSQAAQDSWPGGTTIGPNTGLGATITAYGATDRLHNNANLSNFQPSLICPRAADTITLPVGMITADEVAMAGARFGIMNHDFFLRNNTWWWTITPGRFNGNLAMPFHVTTHGDLNVNTGVTSTPQTRPVISLNANVLATGNGSAADPYIITGLYEPVDPGSPGGNNSGNQGGGANYNPPTSVPGLLAYSVLAAGSLVAYILIGRRKERMT